MSDDARRACGERLREARRRLGLSQAALAGRVGVTQPSLHQWEAGVNEPAFKNRLLLAEVLGFDPFAVDPEGVAS